MRDKILIGLFVGIVLAVFILLVDSASKEWKNRCNIILTIAHNSSDTLKVYLAEPHCIKR